MGESMKDTGSRFMRETRSENTTESPQKLGMPQPPLEQPYPPEATLIDLPEPESLHVPALDVRAAIEQRVTRRRYAEQPYTLPELAFLLWCTQGVKQMTERPATLRTVPSAGARHAFETYLLINRVEGVRPGIYRYIALEHALLEIDLSEDANRRATDACFFQKQVQTSAVTFFWAAALERMAWRYTERGYRYLHLDAGHVCQNLYLAAEVIGAGVCAIAAFDDPLLNQTLKLDGENNFVVYVASTGKRAA
jgi:SagB-type dehydrogenase family enzyme